MPRLTFVHPDQADPDVRALIDRANGGPQAMRWNVFSLIALHPQGMRALLDLRDAFNRDLTPSEHELIAVESARHNGCGYCAPAHRLVCEQIGFNRDDADALMRGELLEHRSDLIGLQRFARSALERKGKLTDAELATARESGVTDRKMLAVLMELAFYTCLNFSNRLAATPSEPEVEPYISDAVAWVTPP
jgi:uncharacterized peroxidase-related enzyme